MRGGLATSVQELIVESDIQNVIIKSYGYKDTFVKHGSVEELEMCYGLDVNSIVRNVKKEVCIQEKVMR